MTSQAKFPKTAVLKRNTLDFRHAIAMSMAVMSPASAIFFNIIPQAALVGAAIPLCYVIAFAVSLLVANQFCLLATELPTSGSWYTFVAQGLNPRWGFIAGWMTLISYGLAPTAVFIIIGFNLHDLIIRWFGLNISWITWFILAIVSVFGLCYFGIKRSLQTDITFLVFEVGVCLWLAFTVLFQLGSKGQLSLVPFKFSEISSDAHLFLGVILAILSFTGFEAAVTLGEEVKKPRQTIPKSVMGSVIIVGIFYLLMSYVATVAYGIQDIAKLAQDAAPFDTIARRYGGNFVVFLIDLAGIISLYAVAVAIVNAGARIFYAISREGLFPRWLSQIHPRYRTPTNAIFGLCGLTLVSGISLGLWLTPVVAFSLLGSVGALTALIIYALVSVACFRYFWTKRRDRFHWLRYGILPLLSVFILGCIGFGTIYPLGSFPLNWAPLIVISWIVLGVGVLIFLQSIKSEEIQRAGALFITDETD
ncbi:APC family permease [Nostoc sp.]|uniref:APC family permease n=1 Tax=Nostoc sp. TaxID=1180 RepID=UPI002FF46FAA